LPTNLPSAFRKAIEQQFGKEAESLLQAIDKEPVAAVRVNPKKPAPEGHLPISSLVEWSPWAAFLAHRPSFILDPLLHAGTYYVQEASSTFIDDIVSQILLPDAPLVLDLCAAPGGKTCGLLSTLPPDALLISNEIVKQRSNILAENVSKWGNSNCIVTQAEPAQLSEMGPTFDLIVADMPCSGEGMFRKNPASVEEWSVDNVQFCAQRQGEILHHAWDMLQPGGYLIYSTCTFNQVENEGVLATFRKEQSFTQPAIQNPSPDQISTTDYLGVHSFRFLPHKTEGEGFFLAVLQKPGFRTKVQTYKMKDPWLRQPNKQTYQQLDKYFPEIKHNIGVFAQQDQVLAFPENWAGFANLLNRYAWVVKTGTTLMTLQHQDAIPHHEVALSSLNKYAKFDSVGLSLEQALDYLRKQAFELPQASKGILHVNYKGFELGWLKNMGNRFNNYYPNEWRIRHA